MDRLGRFGDGDEPRVERFGRRSLFSGVAFTNPGRMSCERRRNRCRSGRRLGLREDARGERDRLDGEDQGERDREENPAVGHAGSVHAPTIANLVPGDRHPVVRGRMRRSSGPGPEPGPWSLCGQVETAGQRSGAGQSPVPDATVSASRRVALNSGAHGPWPARTNGDDSIDSKVCGSVTKLCAHASIAERSRS